MDTYLVGGAVRDALLGLPVTENDWVVVGATPEDMLSRGYRQVGRDFPVYLHPETREEYALARTERKSGEGHRGFVVHSDPSVTLEEDLQRRDLTINAIARDAEGNTVDPYGGQADLSARVLRHVSPAFVEDPLRVLRVARFMARLAHMGFEVADETRSLMTEIAGSGELRTLPPERLWKEFEKALAEHTPSRFFTTLSECTALQSLLPELASADLQRIDRVRESGGDAEQVFAALLADLPAAALDSLFKRLRPPRRYMDLATLCQREGARYTRAHELDAEEILSLLEQLDAFRRPERAQAFLDAAALCWPDADNRALLERALSAAESVSVAEFANANLGGKEIGRQLRRRRREEIETALAAAQ